MPAELLRISVDDASHQFTDVIGRVRAGETIVITSSFGTPVATLAPSPDYDAEAEAKAEAEWKAAHEALFHRLRTQRNGPVEPWTRDELYDD